MEKSVSDQSRAEMRLPKLDAVPRAKHFVTAGEKKFDRVTYTGIGYLLNASLSVVAVALVERTPGGKRMIENFSNWCGRAFKLDAEKAKFVANKSFFLSGGFAVLAPMKWLEDAKVGLVQKWNRQIYGDAAENDPRIQQSERELEAAPKQTWSSIFSSRVLALVPFYLTYGALWDRKSTLSRITNSTLHGMDKAAVKAMEEAQPAAFSQLTAKGFYIDKPIATVSRAIGKVVAKVTGNEKALAKLGEMETTYPGTIRSMTNAQGNHDPAHAVVPYYFISEAITSAMVAWGVYALTRVTGPFFDKKRDHSMQPVPWQPSNSAIPIAETRNRETEIVPAKLEVLQSEKPETQIVAKSVLQDAAVAQANTVSQEIAPAR